MGPIGIIRYYQFYKQIHQVQQILSVSQSQFVNLTNCNTVVQLSDMSNRYSQFHSRNFIALVNYDTIIHVNPYSLRQTGMISFTCESTVFTRYDQFHSRNFLALVNYDTGVHVNQSWNSENQIFSFSLSPFHCIVNCDR